MRLPGKIAMARVCPALILSVVLFYPITAIAKSNIEKGT